LYIPVSVISLIMLLFSLERMSGIFAALKKRR
jgi:hypothetical protein